MRHWLTTYVMKTPLPLVLCIILKPNLSLMLPFLSSTVMNLVGPELESDISQEIVTNIWWSHYKFLCNQNLDTSENHYFFEFFIYIQFFLTKSIYLLLKTIFSVTVFSWDLSSNREGLENKTSYRAVLLSHFDQYSQCLIH